MHARRIHAESLIRFDGEYTWIAFSGSNKLEHSIKKSNN
jgi:hypothetical protein